jgi:hypothetical protein
VVGALLTWQLAADVVRMSVAPLLDAAGPWPPSGETLVLYLVDHLVGLSVRFTVLAAVTVHFARASPMPVLLALVGTGSVLVITKMTTAASLVPFHQSVSGFTAVTRALLVAWRAVRRRAEPTPDGAHAALLVLVATDLMNAVVHASQAFDASWHELLCADTAAVGLMLLGYVAALGKEAAQQWRQAS